MKCLEFKIFYVYIQEYFRFDTLHFLIGFNGLLVHFPKLDLQSNFSKKFITSNNDKKCL